jgi:ComF family protein
VGIRSLGTLGAADGALRRVVAAVADLLLPVVCVSCERLLDASERGIVCGRCWSRLAPLPFPHCTRCGHPIDRYSCRWCPQLPPYVRAVRSVCWMTGGTGAPIVHALKYHGWSRAADGMGERMARLAWPRDVLEERAALVPVPLARDRERARGFNQSALLAGAIGVRWRVPVWCDVIERGRTSASQTRLTPEERRRNVAGAIRAATDAARRLRGQHVVLVDDVVTTAATLSACAAALVAGGARIVSCVTFGRARA